MSVPLQDRVGVQCAAGLERILVERRETPHRRQGHNGQVGNAAEACDHRAGHPHLERLVALRGRQGLERQHGDDAQRVHGRWLVSREPGSDDCRNRHTQDDDGGHDPEPGSTAARRLPGSGTVQLRHIGWRLRGGRRRGTRRAVARIPGRVGRRNFSHFADEAIPLPRNRDDVAMGLPVIAEHLAKG